jgi:MoxR-like ATPase
VYDRDSIDAIQAAFNAQRPLLIRGEPGIGKSQLAYAAAAFLGWPILPFTVTATTESTDLLWHFDAVARLAEAQVKDDGVDIKLRLAFKRFLKPGVLWRAFNWQSACDQAADYLADCSDGSKTGADGSAPTSASGINPQTTGDTASFPLPENWQAGQGCVVLIDEIDKADSDLPNSLLEALGNWQFTVPYLPQDVGLISLPDAYRRPLIIITTNNERQLPPAFIRRCLVLDMALPREKAALKKAFENYALAHFKHDAQKHHREWNTIVDRTFEAVYTDREKARSLCIPAPSVAEYIDLLRVILNDPDRQPLDLLPIMEKFVLGKHNPETD